MFYYVIMPRFGNRVRVHPERCTCRMCKKKKKQRRKETRWVVGSMYGLFLFVIIIGSL